MNLGIKFNAKAFADAFIGKKVSRFIYKLFDGIGEGNLSYMVRMDRDVLSYISAEDIQRYRQAIYGYADIAGQYTDDQIYSWIPKEQRAILESYPAGRGKDWALRQIKEIRKALFDGTNLTDIG